MNIAVVIPTYNRSLLVKEALDSVFAQTRKPDQIIVVDDGSTDDTRATLIPYIARGVRYEYQENAYLSAARNKGLNLLRVDIEAVLFLDSDDRLLPEALERLEPTLASSPNAPLVYGRPRLIGPEGEPTGDEWEIPDFDGPKVWDKWIRRNFICTAGCVLIRRKDLDNAGGFDTELRHAEDWDMWLRLTEQGQSVVRVASPQKPTMEYRVSPGSMSKHFEVNVPIEQKLLRKHLERPALIADPKKRERLATLIAERDANIQKALAEGASAEVALLSSRHRKLRGLLGRLGVAGSYRRLPLPVRLFLRERFGIDRSA